MMVLSRKTDDSIFISGGIEVVILEVRGKTVRLGVRAPSEVAVEKKECASEATPLPETTPLNPAAARLFERFGFAHPRLRVCG